MGRQVPIRGRFVRRQVLRCTSTMHILNTLTPNANATGFRLPRDAEWELAARFIGDLDNDGDIKGMQMSIIVAVALVVLRGLMIRLLKLMKIAW